LVDLPTLQMPSSCEPPAVRTPLEQARRSKRFWDAVYVSGGRYGKSIEGVGHFVERRTFLRGSIVLAAGTLARAPLSEALFPAAQAATEPYRAFADTSEWNQPLPVDAPTDPSSDAFIDHLKNIDGDIDHPRLVVGAGAAPIFWAREGDPEYILSEFAFPVRIPAHARPASASDAQLTVYDVERGYVIKLHRAVFDGKDWSANSASIYYLESNGLIWRLQESDDERNRGHRGYPPPLHAVRWDEIQAGAIEHVLKVAINRTAPRHVYPGGGDEDGTGLIPEGAVLRIRPSVDLLVKNLSASARVIATAMQRYGIVVGDQSGIPMALKVESLSMQSVAQQWIDVGIDRNSLSRITFDDFECIQLGYHRPVTT